jgi:hypothetical protein
MKCNPFGDKQPLWSKPDNRAIVSLLDSQKKYKARNEGGFLHNAFKLDKYLLKEETGMKQCDFLLLRCPRQQVIGCVFFIEYKDSRQKTDIKQWVMQLTNSFDKMMVVYPGWTKDYPKIGFRITASITQRELTSRPFEEIKKLAKRHGGSFDIRRFDLEKEMDVFNGIKEFEQRP